MINRLEDELASGTMDLRETYDPLPWGRSVLAAIVLAAAVIFLFGCATVKTAYNISDDLSLILDQVHSDIQAAIQDPTRMEAVVVYLCDDARMLRADECARLKAAAHIRVMMHSPIPAPSPIPGGAIVAP